MFKVGDKVRVTERARHNMSPRAELNVDIGDIGTVVEADSGRGYKVHSNKWRLDGIWNFAEAWLELVGPENVTRLRATGPVKTIHIGVNQQFIKMKSDKPWFVQTYDSCGAELQRIECSYVKPLADVAMLAETNGDERKARVTCSECEYEL